MNRNEGQQWMCMCNNNLFKLQWQIFRPFLEKECFGPGFASISPLSIIIQEPYQTHLSKIQVIRKYVTFLMCGLIMTLIFFMIKLLIMSNLVKLKLWHMDAYDGTSTEQQVELLI